MEQIMLESRDPSRFAQALDAALRLCGSPQYLSIRVLDGGDHAYLDAGTLEHKTADGWKQLPPGAPYDAAAAELAASVPGIASRGFLIRLLDARGRTDGAAFYVEPCHS